METCTNPDASFDSDSGSTDKAFSTFAQLPRAGDMLARVYRARQHFPEGVDGDVAKREYVAMRFRKVSLGAAMTGRHLKRHT